MFSCLIILLYSASVLTLPNGRNEVVYPSLETLRSGIKIMKFRAFEQDIELRLEPAGDVISNDFTIMNEKGNIKAIDVISFKEKLFRDQKKGAALYIDDDGFVEIDGVINSKLRIEPSESQEVRAGMKEHVITEILEEKMHFRDSVNISKLPRSFSRDKARTFNEDQCVEIEYIFVADKSVLDKFPDVKQFKAYLGTVFVQVQTILDTLKLKIKFRALGLISLETDPNFITNSLLPGVEVLDVTHILSNTVSYVCANMRRFEKADIVMLFTGRHLGDVDQNGEIWIGTLGVANLGGACSDCEKAAVVIGSDDKRTTAVTVAHESAHLLGCPHDGEGVNDSILPGSPGSESCPKSDGFIMGETSEENKDKFSSCSLENIKYFLGESEASCLIKQC